MKGQPCNICGGTDVNLVDGFYYCIECGTQDMTLRETIVEATELADGTFAKSRRYKVRKTANIQMSGEWHKWHAYNFIIYGLADELIELGAKPSFKLKLLWIWSRYIKKYNIKEQYEKNNASKRNTFICDTDNSDDDKEISFQINGDAQKPISKTNHKGNINIQVFTYRVMYGIILAALNLDRSNIQVSDFMRFIREGRLSMNICLKYIPPELKVKSIPQWPNFSKSYYKQFTNVSLLKMTCAVIKDLDLGAPNAPDFAELVTRYCKELCLPKDFKSLVLSLMQLLPPESSIETYMRYTIRLPDFESVVMSYIVVALKMCFGLDDVYDVKISQIVDEINDEENHLKYYRIGYSEPTDRLFSFCEWIKYLEFRKSVICKYYEPMASQYGLNIDNCLIVESIQTKPEGTKKHVRDEMTNEILQKLPLFNVPDGVNKEEFPASLTPLTAYTELLLLKIKDHEIRLKLSEDFAKYDLKYACTNLYLTPDSITENFVKGVDVANKVINNKVQGTLRFYTMKLGKTQVFVKDVNNERWLHDFKISEGLKDTGIDFTEEIQSVSVITTDDATEMLEEIGQDESIFGATEINAHVTDISLQANRNDSFRSNSIHEFNIENNIIDENELNNTLSYNNMDLDVLDLNSTAVFDPHLFNREEVTKHLVLIECRKHKIPIPLVYRDKQPKTRSPKKDKEATAVNPRIRQPGVKTSNDILALYRSKLEHNTNDNESRILNATKTEIDDEMIAENDVQDTLRNDSIIDIEVSPLDINESSDTISVELLNETKKETSINECNDDNSVMNQDFIQTDDKMKEIVNNALTNDNQTDQETKNNKRKAKSKRILPILVDQNTELDINKYEDLIRNSDVKEFKYCYRHYKKDMLDMTTSRTYTFETDMLENFPKSFNYVIHTCASIIEVTPFQLYRVMQNLEMAIIKRYK